MRIFFIPGSYVPTRSYTCPLPTGRTLPLQKIKETAEEKQQQQHFKDVTEREGLALYFQFALNHNYKALAFGTAQKYYQTNFLVRLYQSEMLRTANIIEDLP